MSEPSILEILARLDKSNLERICPEQETWVTCNGDCNLCDIWDMG